MSGEVIRGSAPVGLLNSRATEGSLFSYCAAFLEPSDPGCYADGVLVPRAQYLGKERDVR
jgi:hypothetical protein